MNKLKKIFKGLSPAEHVIVLLLILSIIEAISLILTKGIHQAVHFLIFGGILIIGSLLVFELLRRITNQRKSYAHAIISTLMIYLVLDHANHNLRLAALLIGLLHISKFFFIRENRPLFNPVALSIGATTLLSLLVSPLREPNLTWEGFNSSFLWFGQTVYLPVFLMGLSIFTNTRRIKRIPLALTFVSVTTLMHSFAPLAIDTQYYFLGVFFIGSLVIIEPKTSPLKDKEQLIYGIGSGVLFYVAHYLYIPSAGMISVLLSNVGWFLYRGRSS